MFKRIIAVVLLLLCAHAHAALPDDYRVVLLTENFPPFNMAEDGKNYAADARIHGINADIVREMFRRANIRYELTLRFPWDRIYKKVLEQPDQGLFSTTFTASASSSSNGSARWRASAGCCWRPPTVLCA